MCRSPFLHQRARSDWEKLESDPGSVLAKAYDVVMNGWEGRRQHPDPPQRFARSPFAMLGLKQEEVQAQFGHLLEAFQYGAPPHGGIALGIDRLTALFAEVTSIRARIVFLATAPVPI